MWDRHRNRRKYIQKYIKERKEKINNINSKKHIERNPVIRGISGGTTDKTLNYHGTRPGDFFG